MLPPGPPGLPGLGHAIPFLRDRLGFLTTCARAYGDVVRLQLGRPTYVLNSPSDLRHVLVEHAANYDKSPRITQGAGRRVSGSTLLAATGPAQRERRRMLQPLFAPLPTAEIAEIVVSASEEIAEAWREGTVVDVRPAMLRLTRLVISRLLFGASFDDAHGAWSRALGERADHYARVLRTPLPCAELLPTMGNIRGWRARRTGDQVVREQLRRVRDGGAAELSLLQQLAVANASAGSPLGDRDIVDEAVAIALAGFETNAEALTWTWYLLGRHPEVQERVAAEAQSADEQRLRAGGLDAFPYTQAVIAEVLRLYPPTWLFVRLARDADVLPSGYDVPAGTQLYCSQWVTQRDPRFFHDPAMFCPERFLAGRSQAAAQLHYFPFGAGPRACIGEALAMLENVLAIANVARRWRLAPVEPRDVPPRPGITLRPAQPIRMRLQRR